MDAIENIFSRRSVSKVLPDPVPRAVIEQLLAAAAQAPNHFRVRPWRFVVISGEARVRMGILMADSLKERKPDSSEIELNKERSRPLRAPVLIAIGVDKPVEPKVYDIENVCACAAAAENILLAANALGLGAMWRTGPAAYNPAVKEFLGLGPDQHLIGFIYIGYPQPEQPPALERPGYEDRVVWMEE